MVDVLDALNSFDLQMQGCKEKENLKTFQKKAIVTDVITTNRELCKIEYVSEIADISVSGQMKQAIFIHIDELAESFGGYLFPTKESIPAWVRQPFTFPMMETLNFSRANLKSYPS